MKESYKKMFLVIGFFSFLFLSHVIWQECKRKSMAVIVSRAHYAVLTNGDSVQRKKISAHVNEEVGNNIKAKASVKILGEKSVSYGKISLLDENLNPIAQIGILKFPLFTFNGTQMKLNLDLVSAYGFSIQGYEPHIK